MILTHSTLGVSAFAIMFLAVRSVVSEPLAIDLVSVEYVAETGQVAYNRRVYADSTIRSAWFTDVVVVSTELSVAECEAHGAASYGPDEPQQQLFDFDIFTRIGCLEALRSLGEPVEIFASVEPLGVRGDIVKSEPFIVE